MLLATADPSPWLAFLGRAHPLILHLPLGLLPALLLLEFGALLFRRPLPRGPILALAWLCAVSAAGAVASGLVLADEGGYDEGAVSDHKIAGITLAALCVAVAVAAFFQRRGPFRVALLLSCIAMVPAGHLGGAMTHGANFLFEPFARDHTDDPTEGNGGGENGGGAQPAPTTEFERTIRPIFERTCTKCHNPEKKKADLLLTTIEGIKKGSEMGEVIVPGKPDESELLVRCELPLDDEDHMPPEGKPQPTKEEIATLRAWIEKGAPFDE